MGSILDLTIYLKHPILTFYSKIDVIAYFENGVIVYFVIMLQVIYILTLHL